MYHNYVMNFHLRKKYHCSQIVCSTYYSWRHGYYVPFVMDLFSYSCFRRVDSLLEARNFLGGSINSSYSEWAAIYTLVGLFNDTSTVSSLLDDSKLNNRTKIQCIASVVVKLSPLLTPVLFSSTSWKICSKFLVRFWIRRVDWDSSPFSLLLTRMIPLNHRPLRPMLWYT